MNFFCKTIKLMYSLNVDNLISCDALRSINHTGISVHSLNVVIQISRDDLYSRFYCRYP